MEKRTEHLTEKDVEDWMAGLLSPGKEQQLLTHAGTCDHCAGLLGFCLEQHLMEPPAYLRDEILEKSQSLEIRTARTIHRTSGQIRLFLYSLKVGFALAVSLSMLFVLPLHGETEFQRRVLFPERAGQTITEKLQSGKGAIDTLMKALTDWTIFLDEEESK